MDEFLYDKKDSFQNNFARWYHMNCTEREMYNEKPLTKKEALSVFENFLGRRFPNLIYRID